MCWLQQKACSQTNTEPMIRSHWLFSVASPLPPVDLELAALPGDRKDLRGAGVGPEQDEQDAEQPPSHQEDALNDVGPDHGLDAADQGVEHGYRSQNQDHAGDVPPRQQGRGQRQKVVGDADVGNPADQKGGGAVGARGVAEPLFQVFVGRHAHAPTVEQHDASGKQQHHDQRDQMGGDQKHVVVEDVSGMSHEGGAPANGAQDGEGHHPSRNAARGQKVVLGGLLPPGKVGPPAERLRSGRPRRCLYQ